MAAEKIDALELDITAQLSTENLDKLVDSLRNLGKEMDKIKNKKPAQAIKDTGDSASEAANGVDKFLTKSVRIAAVIALFSKLSDTIGDCISKSLTYEKTLNMFTVSMGEYADNATKYGETVSDALGIDIAGWQKAQGIFQTLVTGFGIGGDQAAYMSQNLTQLSYDIASFYGITNEEAQNKLKSAIAGRLEPIRKLGYDLSQSKLVDIAKNPANYGKQTYSINEQTGAIEANTTAVDDNTRHKIVNFNQLTQQEKVQLRYIALMTQVTQVQGNYAKTLSDPVNQMRIFKEQTEMTSRALGNIFIPALNQVLPYLTAFTQLAGEAFKAIASWFGYEIPDMSDRMDVSGSVQPYNDIVKATGKAAGNAKKLKDYTIGLDELNVLKKPDESGAGGSGVGGQQSNLSNLLTPGYDFLSKAVKSSIEQAKKDIQSFFDDLKKRPISLPIEIFTTGASILGENFWTAVLGKTPEELAKEALANGKTIGEQFLVAFKDSVAEAGSKFWEWLLGSPEDMQKEAEKSAKTVEEVFVGKLEEKLTGELKSQSPTLIGDWLAKLFGIDEATMKEVKRQDDAFAKQLGEEEFSGVFGTLFGKKKKQLATGSGSTKTYGAALNVQAPTVSFGNTSADEARKAGERLAQAYSEGISSGKGTVNTAGASLYNSGVRGADGNGRGGQMFNNTAANEAYKYAMGLSSAKSKSEAYVGGMTLASQGAKGSKALANDSNVGFNYAGQMSGKGYIAGIEKYKSKSSSSGRIIAEAALKTLKNVLGIHSPSTEFGEAGLDSVLGYANWIKKYSYLAENASAYMADSALQAVQTANAYGSTNAGYGIGMANTSSMATLASNIYNAVVSGMAGVGGQGDTIVMIDGKEIYRVVRNEERKAGVSISNGAFAT